MRNREDQRYKVLVLDMQPIIPAVGGGRLRLLGLYHGLGTELPTTYVGTYDWPGEKYRRHRLSNTLEEVDIPLSNEHFRESDKWRSKAGGKSVIDTSFHQLAHLSPQFVAYAKDEAVKADIIIFSHPWVYPLVKEVLRENQLIIYESHNMEGVLRTELLDDGSFGTEIVKEVIKVEHELCHRADIILSCSHEDSDLFHKLYSISFSRLRTVPNGVFTKRIFPRDTLAREKEKRRLGLEGNMTAIFIGSAYAPNIEAAQFICNVLSPAFPHITFVICGGVGDALDQRIISNEHHSNVHITGLLDETLKFQYLAASDIALNPMTSGSGTNIKMFDFMAAGLPVISSPVGARGIEDITGAAIHICPLDTFAQEIDILMKNKQKREILAVNARILVEEKYSWERISANLGLLLKRQCQNVRARKPFFSVIVPTFERHGTLSKLMKLLSVQKWQNFEVIVVDQSRQTWPDSTKDFGVDLMYIRSDIMGAVKARNRAAFHAQGEVLAFIDDDCEPMPEWLQNARTYFAQDGVIGVEGFVRSKRRGNPDYRSVTNVDFEGIGFMTANLFLKFEVFQLIGGFDELFDNPHFREDSDLGWRALSHGSIPFAYDVEVYHPPHKRSVRRESESERLTYFEKDALLLKKHPDKYKTLFLMEGHWKLTQGFWEHFIAGAQKYGVVIPQFYLSYMETASIVKGRDNDIEENT